MKPTRIAVAGVGLIGVAHLNAIAANARLAIASIVDPSPAAMAIAQKYGTTLYASIDELLAHDKPDAIVLATPNQLHISQAIQCIQAGVAVLIEKPIATTVAEGETLLDVMRSTQDARVLVGHHRAHSPIMAKAKQVIDSGALGRIVAIMGSSTFLKPDHYFVDGPWRTKIGGGPILINMIHEVHNFRMLCGDIIEVQAFTSNAVRHFEVEDTAAINLRFANGVLGTFLLSDVAASAKNWEHTSGENKAYPFYDNEDCYTITGTNGSLAVPTMRIKTYPREADRSWWKPFECGTVGMVRDDPIKHQMEHFGQVARGEAQPIVSARDGLQNLRVTEAIAAAAKSGQVIRL